MRHEQISFSQKYLGLSTMYTTFGATVRSKKNMMEPHLKLLSRLVHVSQTFWKSTAAGLIRTADV